MRIMGIYKIQSLVKPERCYVGSAIDMDKRWSNHLSDLRNNRHPNKKLKNHFNKYGEGDLIFIMVEPCLPEFLTIREQFYIDALVPWFNICKVAGSQLGFKHSKESKKRMSEFQILNKVRPPSRLGTHDSKETREKKSNSLKGKNTWMNGTHPSEDTLMKKSNSMIITWSKRKSKKAAS